MLFPLWKRKIIIYTIKLHKITIIELCKRASRRWILKNSYIQNSMDSLQIVQAMAETAHMGDEGRTANPNGRRTTNTGCRKAGNENHLIMHKFRSNTMIFPRCIYPLTIPILRNEVSYHLFTHSTHLIIVLTNTIVTRWFILRHLSI